MSLVMIYVCNNLWLTFDEILDNAAKQEAI